MIGAHRRRAYSVGGALVLGGTSLLVVYWCVAALTALITGVASRAPVLVAYSGYAYALPAAMALLLFALIELFAPGERWQRRLFGTALGCFATVLVLPIAHHVIIAYSLPERGYRECDRRVVGTRFATSVWVRGDEALCYGDVVI
jgi:hypothetical protein